MDTLTAEEAYRVMYDGYPEILSVNDICKMLDIGRRRAYSKLLKSGFDRTYDGFVCRDNYGKLITLKFVSQHFRIVIENHNLKLLRFHDLRHSCASLLLANGVSMKAIQEWLGHSTFNITANLYSHLEYHAKVTSAETIAKALGGVTEEQPLTDNEDIKNRKSS